MTDVEQITDVENAIAIIKRFDDKRRALIEKNVELADERQRIAFLAHSGDKKARARLDAINSEASIYVSELQSIEAAGREANNRLDTAQRAEAMAADKAAALQLREKLAKLTELGLIIDDCFADLNSAGTEMKEVLNAIHSLGCPSPTHEQLRVLGALALKTALQGTPIWAKEFEPIPPNQRRTFRSLVIGWQDMIERNIEQRLGEKKDAA